MRVFLAETKYFKSASRLLDRDCVNKRGLNLSKEVLWVSVGQRAAELPAIKVGGRFEKKSAPQPGVGKPGPIWSRNKTYLIFPNIFEQFCYFVQCAINRVNIWLMTSG